MKYLLVDLKGHRKILCLEDKDFDSIYRRLSRGYMVRQISRPPSKTTLNRWRKCGKCKALCGCWVGPQKGSRCTIHNTMNWFTALIGVE